MSIINPSTFLELVQRLCIECKIANYPTTLVDASGQTLELAGWINESWKEIQSKHEDWFFMKSDFSFATIASQSEYTPTEAGIAAGVVGSWRRNTFRNYHTSTGQSSEIEMTYRTYDEWRDLHQIGSLRTSEVRPMEFTITPADAIGLQTPLAGYTITGEYFRAPTTLDEDADTIDLPEQFIMAPIYRAMMFYGASEAAPDVYNNGEREFNKLMGRMSRRQLQAVTDCGALA